MRKVCNELEKTNLWFQNEVDSNLIDACIHQRKVLKNNSYSSKIVLELFYRVYEDITEYKEVTLESE